MAVTTMKNIAAMRKNLKKKITELRPRSGTAHRYSSVKSKHRYHNSDSNHGFLFDGSSDHSDGDDDNDSYLWNSSDG
ncbi:hypothetical protein U1Q18_051006 [Sarracenia purpurea var. burkii]